MFEGSEVRIAGTSEAPLFCAIDICAVLGLSNSRVAVAALDEDERSKLNLPRQGETHFVTESGLYHLIFKSRKPAAKRFRRWVTEEVLPALRVQGRYEMIREADFVTLPEWLVVQGVDVSVHKDRARKLLTRAWESAKLLGYRGQKLNDESGLVLFPAEVLRLAEDRNLPEIFSKIEESKHVLIESVLNQMEAGREYTTEEMAILANFTGSEKKRQQDVGQLMRKLVGMEWHGAVVERVVKKRRVLFVLRDAEA